MDEQKKVLRNICFVQEAYGDLNESQIKDVN